MKSYAVLMVGVTAVLDAWARYYSEHRFRLDYIEVIIGRFNACREILIAFTLHLKVD